MPSRLDVLTPANQGTRSRLSGTPVGTPQDYISPSTRRHVGLTSPAGSFLPPAAMNDDAKERRERRRSKILELQRRNLSSPATPSDRRRSTPLGGLSNAQLTDHYASCIKLSAENKINAKNAFGLHLIDYMSELLRKKDMNNFQVASSTLDASAKIYAGRVDAIHSETYKVLTGLGRSSDKNKDGEQEGGEEGEAIEGQEPGEKKRKRARKSNTIETNLKNINVSKFDLEFEVDPFFKKTSSLFDEGGTGGLLLNHLRCLDDNSELIFDSNTIVTGLDEEPTQSQSERGSKPVDLKALKDMYAGVNLNCLQVCPQFADFEFTNWNKSGEETFSFAFHQNAKSDHAFDLEAEPEPIPDSCQSDATMADVIDDGFGLLGGDDDDDDNDAGSVFTGDGDQSEHMLGDGQEAQMVENAINNMKHGTIGTLMQILASEPTEYSYFNSNILRTWAGPAHWKLRPRSKDFPGADNTQDNKTSKKPKEKKEAFIINYNETIDFDSYFKETRAATTLTKATLDRYSKSQTTLPEDLHYDAEKLFRLFCKPKILIKRQKAVTEGLDDNIDNYDYENANDRDNFCPGVEGGDDDDDDNDDNDGGIEFNFTAGANEYSQNSVDDDLTGQGSFLANDSLLNGTMLTGDNLLAQPRKGSVARIDIAYAKTAKKMDVKRLKASMWGILTKPPPEPAKTEAEAEAEKDGVDNAAKDVPLPAPGNTSNVMGDHSFQDMVKVLPRKVSKHMAQNLSVPIAFVCLLHLANEKILKIECDEAMTDLRIMQG